jgi:hypothetical protein
MCGRKLFLAKQKGYNKNELERQFRLLGQMLTMHSVLVSRFSRLALMLDVALLAASVVFCATTFVSDDFFSSIGLTPKIIRLLLGIFSLLAFFAALVSLRVDWKASEARHKEAASKLGSTLALFRQTRNRSGGWAASSAADLNSKYWETMNGITPIPNRLFAPLKAKHLRKIEISMLLDSHSGIPIWFLRFLLFSRSIKKLLSRAEH